MKLYYTADEVSKMLKCDAQCLRVQAKEDGSKLGFPVSIIGNSVRIPVKSFDEFWGIKNDQHECES